MKPSEKDLDRMWKEMEALLARCVKGIQVAGHLKARQILEHFEAHAADGDERMRSVCDYARLGILVSMLDAAQADTLTAEGTGK